MKLRLTTIDVNNNETIECEETTFAKFVEANGGDDAITVYENFEGRDAAQMERALREVGVIDLPQDVGSYMRVQVIG